MKFRGDDRELLRGLWATVQSAGGLPSINMIQKMARLAGASFDDKAARAILFGNRKNITNTEVTPPYLHMITEASPRRTQPIDREPEGATETTPAHLRTITEATPRHNQPIGHEPEGATESAPQHLRAITEVAPRRNQPIDHEPADAAEAAPRYLRTIAEATPRRDVTKTHNTSRDENLGHVTEAAPQYLRMITDATPEYGFGEIDNPTVTDAATPNLFDALVDPLEVEPLNDGLPVVPASGIAPPEVLAPGIARLMEISKKAKAVNTAAAMRAAAKSTPKAIRYIFPSERKN